MVRWRVVLVLLLACRPDVDEHPSRLASPRILALRSEPAEVAPGEAVAYDALVVDGTGAPFGQPFTWSFCTDRKPLAELGPVSPRCFADDSSVLAPIGLVPSDACRRFGPDVPPSNPNESPGRPTDPDETGGFYQPVRFQAGELVAIERTRLACGLGNISSDLLAQFRQRYQRNTNPRVENVLADEAPLEGRFVRPGERVTLRPTWPPCSAPKCEGREPYAVYDPQSGSIVDRVEAMLVSWFATGGTFAEDRTANDAENVWTAPAQAGPIRAFVVVRDDRGGSGWREVRFDVR